MIQIEPVLTILVPVYNEENTLKEILQRITALPIGTYEIIVVNDASTDKSTKIIKDFQKEFNSQKINFQVIHHRINSGKGRTIQSAVRLAKGKYFVVQDADLEYLPEDLPKLLKHALENDYAVVYGSRFLGSIQNMPHANYYANRFYNFLLRRLYNTSITDMHTCYKLIKTQLLKELNISSSGFGYAPELVSKLLGRNVIIEEIPISFYGRTKKEGKKINVKDGIECIISLLKYRLQK